MNIGWVLKRLGAMSGAEIAHRIRTRAQSAIEQLGVAQHEPPAPLAVSSGRAWLDQLPRTLDPAKYRRAAEATLAGRFHVFALRSHQLGFPPQWNRDPKTGTVAPRTFGKTLNYRDESLVGDIKYLWEPSRHAELVTLAQAWHLSRDPRYAEGCRILLDSWFEQCPQPFGPHWSSSLEHAVRLINWAFAWHLLGADSCPLFAGAEGAAFKRRWQDGIYRHCHFIAQHFSRFSSANNHLLGELTGLFVASLTWPLWPQSAGWRDTARAELQIEALKQNGLDGVNREQANWYHQEVADMLLISGLYARANGCDFGADYWQRLRAMCDYLASIMDVGGHVPNFGDADDAVIARLDPAEDADAYGALLGCAAIVFDAPELKCKARTLHDKALWLFGDAASTRWRSLETREAKLPLRRRFDDAGYYVLGTDFETPREIRIVADAGPLGYLSIAAHGHADALSFTLSAAGEELLIDPGTFAYHTQKHWRDYFRGTAAHNTVRIDGQDQSVSGGNFLWTAHAASQLLECIPDGPQQRMRAQHRGYLRLSDPVLHRRELRFDCKRRTLTVVDELDCKGTHEVELFWHFAEHCVIECKGSILTARAGTAALRMIMPKELNVEVQRGREMPPLGWISRRFDVRQASPTVRAWQVIHGRTRLETAIHISTDSVDPRVAQITPHSHGMESTCAV